MNFDTKESWIIQSPIEKQIKEKVDKIGVPLKDWNVKISRGILTGYNPAFIINGETRTNILNGCKTPDERTRTDALIRPILRGKDVQRYESTFADQWALFIPWHFPLHTDSSIVGASEKAEVEFSATYPTVYSHLLMHKEKLSARNKAETGIRYEWYALQRWGAKYWEDFSKQKMVWKRVGSSLRFSYDDTGMLSLDSTCIITGDNIKFLVALFNSKMGRYLLKDSPKTGVGDLIISVQALEPIPVPLLSEDEQKPIIEKLDAIIKLKGQNKGYEMLVDELDETMFNIYQISDSEKEFIVDYVKKHFP